MIRKAILIGLASLASVSAYAGLNVKIDVDTQNAVLKGDIETYMQSALAQFYPYLSVTQDNPDETLTVEPRSSGNTFFFDILLVGKDGKFYGNTTGVCVGSENEMRKTFRDAVVSMARNGSFEAAEGK
jgi:hypothetical protein